MNPITQPTVQQLSTSRTVEQGVAPGVVEPLQTGSAFQDFARLASGAISAFSQDPREQRATLEAEQESFNSRLISEFKKDEIMLDEQSQQENWSPTKLSARHKKLKEDYHLKYMDNPKYDVASFNKGISQNPFVTADDPYSEQYMNAQAEAKALNPSASAEQLELKTKELMRLDSEQISLEQQVAMADLSNRSERLSLRPKTLSVMQSQGKVLRDKVDTVVKSSLSPQDKKMALAAIKAGLDSVMIGGQPAATILGEAEYNAVVDPMSDYIAAADSTVISGSSWESNEIRNQISKMLDENVLDMVKNSNDKQLPLIMGVAKYIDTGYMSEAKVMSAMQGYLSRDLPEGTNSGDVNKGLKAFVSGVYKSPADSKASTGAAKMLNDALTLNLAVPEASSPEAVTGTIKFLGSAEFKQYSDSGRLSDSARQKLMTSLETVFKDNYLDDLEGKFKNEVITKTRLTSGGIGASVEQKEVPLLDLVDVSQTDGNLVFNVKESVKPSDYRKVLTITERLNKSLGQPVSVLIKGISNVGGLTRDEVYNRYFRPFITGGAGGSDGSDRQEV